MKFSLELSLTYGIPPVLISDGGQEVVGNFVTEGPLVRQPHTSRVEKRVKCATLLVNGQGKAENIKKLCGGGDVLVEVLEQ
jgi:hypothetical protein